VLDRLRPSPGSRRYRTRKGRGISSGHGKTCGRGQKGAGARSGTKRRPWYEGGQMPLARRIPKGGFTNIFRVPFQVVNLKSLGRFGEGTTVDAEALHGAGLIASRRRPVKILADGELGHAVAVRVDAVSGAARQKIEAAGGTVEVVPARRAQRPQRKEGS
jgi:large subunit ribosomal protein L15